MDTRTDLVAKLEALLPSAGATKASRIRTIIEAAKRGEYHDYKSPHATPKVNLVVDLQRASLNGIAKEVINGNYDEKADAEDVAEMAAELKDEPELRRMLKLPDPGKT